MAVTPEMSSELNFLGCHRSWHPHRDSSHPAPASHHFLPASSPVVHPRPEDVRHRINPKLSYQPKKKLGGWGEAGALARPPRFTPWLQKPLSRERRGGRSCSVFLLHPNSLNFLLLGFFVSPPPAPAPNFGGPWRHLAPPAVSPKQHPCNSRLSIPKKTPHSLFPPPKYFWGLPQTFLPPPAPHRAPSPPSSVGDRRAWVLPDEFPEATEPLIERNRARSGARCSLINRLLITNEVSPLQYL